MSNRPRLTIDITKKQKAFLDSLPFGWKQQLFSIIIDKMIDMVARCGRTSLGVIISKKIDLEEVIKDDNNS